MLGRHGKRQPLSIDARTFKIQDYLEMHFFFASKVTVFLFIFIVLISKVFLFHSHSFPLYRSKKCLFFPYIEILLLNTLYCLNPQRLLGFCCTDICRLATLQIKGEVFESSIIYDYLAAFSVSKLPAEYLIF